MINDKDNEEDKYQKTNEYLYIDFEADTDDDSESDEVKDSDSDSDFNFDELKSIPKLDFKIKF